MAVVILYISASGEIVIKESRSAKSVERVEQSNIDDYLAALSMLVVAVDSAPVSNGAIARVLKSPKWRGEATEGRLIRPEG